MNEKTTKKNLVKRFLAGFSLFFVLISMLLGGIMTPPAAYAEETTPVAPASETEPEGETNISDVSTDEKSEAETAEGETTEDDASDKNSDRRENEKDKESLKKDGCQDSLGSIDWLVCPVTGKVAQAADWLFDRLENILTINPVLAQDGSPIYEIWKYCRGITNIVFIIFLLIVIYSQITGVGISNYGIKKVLPKMIVVAILVNLSFVVCSLAVDLSNIFGNGLRGVFYSVMEATSGNITIDEATLSQTSIYSAIAGGTALAIGGVTIAFESGAIWMLIPVVLGAFVSIATGLITVALRQAVVMLLIMISPVAIVCHMLPNTENLFTRWRKLLTQMLVFYPMFSLLFGASSLAGFAIITSAKDGFMVMLGMAVEFYPLFFGWKLMKMSGTFLASVNQRLNGLAARPLMANRMWANSHRELTRSSTLAKERALTPSAKLMQFLDKRRIVREVETMDKRVLRRDRGLAYKASLNYDKNGVPTRRGEEEYEEISRSLEYKQTILRNRNNMTAGLGQLRAVEMSATDEQKERLARLDARIVNASDYLKVEQARTESIEHENARGFYQRLEKAVQVHEDDRNGYEEVVDENGRRTWRPRADYKFNEDPNSDMAKFARGRYAGMSAIMEGKQIDIQYAAATAARAYSSQQKIHDNTFQNYYALTPPTKTLEYKLDELTRKPDAARNMDTIIAGLRVLSQRGDTDIVKKQLDQLIEEGGGVELGTHASQSLASFLMFDVKDSDPFLRRYGKYINLETANVYNKNARKKMNVDFEEYINGFHVEPDGEVMFAKKGMVELMEGTPFGGVERTAYGNMDDSIKKVFTRPDGTVDWEKYVEKRKSLFEKIMPAVLSASMKYDSGSEAMKAVVKTITGYSEGKNGAYQAVWETSPFFRGHEQEAKELYRKLTKTYINSQTLGQLANERSDFKDAYILHLSEDFIDDAKDEELTDEEKTKRTFYREQRDEIDRKHEERMEEIRNTYGDEPVDDAARKARDEAIAEETENYWSEKKKMLEKPAAREMRRILRKKDNKLAHLERTLLKSSAGAGSKDWFRNWIVEKDDDERKIDEGDESSGEFDTSRENDEARARVVMARIEQIFNSLDNSTTSGETFYQRTLKCLIHNYGKHSMIVQSYKSFHQTRPNGNKTEYMDELKDLLDEES